ncbi:EAL domain-containing protein [Qipengyuania zhejiangensis]|uniref:EAL domain-containing protein n=1 Tax=Qipengyuania zhejiangensis TaxID=3077782 RepID=UPI002D770FF3|nr:EAL domain-containing protein [Qipengyuania sp. Z2]
MGIERAFSVLRKLPLRYRGASGGRVRERLRHAFWAALIALGMSTVVLLEPVDQFMWLIQSKMGGHKASGDIVFVGANDVMNDPNLPHRRVELAKALDELERRGVGKVYLDIVFDEPAGSKYDNRLADAIAALGPRVALADQIRINDDDQQIVKRTSAAIGRDASRVLVTRQEGNYFGLVWTARYGYEIDGKIVPTLSAVLGGKPDGGTGFFPIDYGFPAPTIQTLDFKDIVEAEPVARRVDLAGKTIVIGHGRQASSARQIVPNGGNAPSSYVPIYAGETLKSGRTGFLSGIAVTLLVYALLGSLLLLAPVRKRRWFGYAAVGLAIPFALIATARLGIRIEASYAIAFLIAYLLFRSRTRWKRRVSLVNQDTGLPTLRALEARLARDHVTHGHVVIARIHNYERVLKTLPAESRGEYILKLVDRLRAADPQLAVFCDGHHLGWLAPTDETDGLVEHLEGLRAIFAAPVQAAGHSIDVGITFGVAAVENDPAGRMRAAIAAAEETSEASEPIKVADTGSTSDSLWDISLRARIDQAMEAGEIYCVYQPKIDAETNTMAGVEALVRWHDPAKGFIQPLHFIQQCEKAGRMDHLTRYVLQSACSAGTLLHFRGTAISMAVNISATLLGDMRIVGMVRNILQATRFDPKYLILEVTETARIADLQTAASILSELRALGVRISFDDFGVGAANFEALYELPFDELKIDRLFVSNIASDSKAKAIVASLASMGRAARITVVAEGVEDPQDINILREIGCQQLQGYAFSRPVPLSNILEMQNFPETGQRANMV